MIGKFTAFENVEVKIDPEVANPDMMGYIVTGPTDEVWQWGKMFCIFYQDRRPTRTWDEFGETKAILRASCFAA